MPIIVIVLILLAAVILIRNIRIVQQARVLPQELRRLLRRADPAGCQERGRQPPAAAGSPDSIRRCRIRRSHSPRAKRLHRRTPLLRDLRPQNFYIVTFYIRMA